VEEGALIQDSASDVLTPSRAGSLLHLERISSVGVSLLAMGATRIILQKLE
jgi:hypothetical protein